MDPPTAEGLSEKESAAVAQYASSQLAPTHTRQTVMTEAAALASRESVDSMPDTPPAAPSGALKLPSSKGQPQPGTTAPPSLLQSQAMLAGIEALITTAEQGGVMPESAITALRQSRESIIAAL
jgi:hypothetical protein